MKTLSAKIDLNQDQGVKLTIDIRITDIVECALQCKKINFTRESYMYKNQLSEVFRSCAANQEGEENLPIRSLGELANYSPLSIS